MLRGPGASGLARRLGLRSCNQRQDLLQGAADAVEPSIDPVEAGIVLVEASVDPVEAGIVLVEAPVDPVKPSVDLIEAAVMRGDSGREIGYGVTDRSYVFPDAVDLRFGHHHARQRTRAV